MTGCSSCSQGYGGYSNGNSWNGNRYNNYGWQNQGYKFNACCYSCRPRTCCDTWGKLDRCCDYGLGYPYDVYRYRRIR